jgi:hypothetical protein
MKMTADLSCVSFQHKNKPARSVEEWDQVGPKFSRNLLGSKKKDRNLLAPAVDKAETLFLINGLSMVLRMLMVLSPMTAIMVPKVMECMISSLVAQCTYDKMTRKVVRETPTQMVYALEVAAVTIRCRTMPVTNSIERSSACGVEERVRVSQNIVNWVGQGPTAQRCHLRDQG